MGLRPAVIAPRLIVSALIVAALGAAVGFAAAATTLAKASPTEPGHKTIAPKPGHTLDLDWKELLPEGERAHFTLGSTRPRT